MSRLVYLLLIMQFLYAQHCGLALFLCQCDKIQYCECCCHEASDRADSVEQAADYCQRPVNADTNTDTDDTSPCRSEHNGQPQSSDCGKEPVTHLGEIAVPQAELASLVSLLNHANCAALASTASMPPARLVCFANHNARCQITAPVTPLQNSCLLLI